MSNVRYAVTLGAESGSLAEKLQKLLNADALIDVVRLALSALRALMFAERQGWQVIMRAPDGQEFSYSLLSPNDIRPLPKQTVGARDFDELADDPKVIRLDRKKAAAPEDAAAVLSASTLSASAVRRNRRMAD
jgi:hypothetical protein